MSSGEGVEYTFACPECGEELEVNEAMRDALLDRGCVICGANVSKAAFTDCSVADSP